MVKRVNPYPAEPGYTLFCKQCRSRSVGFWRSQLIWICTVYYQVCKFIATIWIKWPDWLKIRSGRGILIYSAGQGLKVKYILLLFLLHLLHITLLLPSDLSLPVLILSMLGVRPDSFPEIINIPLETPSIRLRYVSELQTKKKLEMCPKDTDAPAWKTWTQITNAKCGQRQTDGRTDRSNTISLYALSTIPLT